MLFCLDCCIFFILKYYYLYTRDGLVPKSRCYSPMFCTLDARQPNCSSLGLCTVYQGGIFPREGGKNLPRKYWNLTGNFDEKSCTLSYFSKEVMHNRFLVSRRHLVSTFICLADNEEIPTTEKQFLSKEKILLSDL